MHKQPQKGDQLLHKNNTTEAHNRQRMLEYEIKHGVEASSIGDTFPQKIAVKGRCKDFRTKRRKYCPTLTAGPCRYIFALSCVQPCDLLFVNTVKYNLLIDFEVGSCYYSGNKTLFTWIVAVPNFKLLLC